MKGVLIILDGLGDLPHKLLNDKTPLEAAETPNLDFFSKRGELGYMYPVKPTYIPESDESIVSIFGNELIQSTRGQLEARGTNIKLVRGDLALRANFATVDSLENKNLIDRRAGRTLTTKEAKLLAKAINQIKMPSEFVFESTIQHRGVLVIKGGLSDSISDNDLIYNKGGLPSTPKAIEVKPLDDDENSLYTANILNDFLDKVYNVLKSHPVNIERKRRGLLPANYLLIRGGGIEPPKLKFYKKWMSVAYMPLEIGFSKTCGMTVFSFNYPKLKKLDVYDNLYKGLKKACKFSIRKLKRNYNKFDYAYIHIKETDLPGHDNKPLEKKMMIEHLDKTLFHFLRKFSAKRKVKIVVTGDHSTPCKLKSHSADPVPVLYYGAEEKSPISQRFTEKDMKKGSLKKIMGKELLSRVGFTR